LPSLLDRAEANLRYGALSGALFEIGRGYGGTKGGPTEWTRLGIVVWGEIASAAPGGAPRLWDLDELKRLISSVASLCNAAPRYLPLETGDATLLHPGRSARATGDGIAGLIGELHPAAPEWRPSPRILMAELALHGLSSGQPTVRRVLLPPGTPPIQRDVALAAPAGVLIGDLVTLAKESVRSALSVELFDLFAGGGMAPGERSVGLRFTFQPEAAAALDNAITAEVDAFTASAAKRYGTKVRGAEAQ
jgi:phenylalanyl-tRNA synthetase beta chain